MLLFLIAKVFPAPSTGKSLDMEMVLWAIKQIFVVADQPPDLAVWEAKVKNQMALVEPHHVFLRLVNLALKNWKLELCKFQLLWKLDYPFVKRT